VANGVATSTAEHPFVGRVVKAKVPADIHEVPALTDGVEKGKFGSATDGDGDVGAAVGLGVGTGAPGLQGEIKVDMFANSGMDGSGFDIVWEGTEHAVDATRAESGSGQADL
jgi:hypothetical protein